MSLSFSICGIGPGSPASTSTLPRTQKKFELGESKRPAPPPRRSPQRAQGECPRHHSFPAARAGGSRAPFAALRPQPPRTQSRSAASGGQRAPGTHRLPEPSRGFGLRRKRGGPAWKAPPTRAQQGPIGALCGKLRPRPWGDAPANQEERLAGGANQKLLECASRGKRTEPEPGARPSGRGRDQRPEVQQVRPMARCRGWPGAGDPRDLGEWAALYAKHEWGPL